jgi:PKD repeat protein
VTDANGNTSTCDATIIVESGPESTPTAVCQDITVYLDVNGVAVISANDVDGGSFATCGIGIVTVSPASFDCSNIGVNAVTLTVTDNIGQVSSCVASVTVLDSIVPQIIGCPSDIVIVPDSVNCTPQVQWPVPTVTDNCTVQTVASHQPGDAFPVGTTLVTYIATDASGNQVLCGFNVTVSPTVLTATIIADEGTCGFNLSCNGAQDGVATVNVAGGCAPYTYLWSNNQTGPVATGLGAGPIAVTVIDASGNSLTVNSVITAPESLEISNITATVFEGGVNVSCSGATDGALSASIQGGSECVDYSFVWTGPNGFTSTSANITGLAEGTYILTVTDANGCEVSASTTLTEPSEVTLAQIQVTDATCKGLDNGEAIVSVTGGTAPYTYLWPATGQTTQLATGLGAGANIVIVTDANGCQYTDTAMVAEPDQIVAAVSPDTSICPGATILLTATAIGGNGVYTFTWNNGLGTGSSQAVNPTQTTVYTVTVEDSTGCEGLPASVTVSMAPVPTPSFTYTLDDPCVFPVIAQFTNTSISGVSYEWLIGGSIYTESDPTVTFEQSGNYAVTLVATSGDGCTASTSQQVVVSPLPSANFSVLSAEGCYPLTVIFGNQSQNGFNYLWDFGNGSTSTSPNPSQTYFNPGSYTVSLVVTNQSGCSDTLALDGAVTVHQPPVADFTVLAPGGEFGGLFEFQNNTILADAYNWDFGDGTESDQFEPTHEFNNYGGYYVTLTAINEFGCADTAIHYVTVDITVGLFVPNALVVGETGLGALFQPIGRGLATYTAQVYDKWGNLLWESSALTSGGEPAEGWDGSYKGEYVPQGAYVWRVIGTFLDGQDWQGMEGPIGQFNTTGSIMVIY